MLISYADTYFLIHRQHIAVFTKNLIQPLLCGFNEAIRAIKKCFVKKI